MRAILFSERDPFILFALTFIFISFCVQPVNARQSDRPFSLDLNLGGGLIGNPGTSTAFQPELGFSYMPGRWGVGLNAGLYRFDSGFDADQYRTGFEEYTVSEQNEDLWRSFFINAGPRFEQNISRMISLKLGFDLAMNHQKGPSQSVRFHDPTGEMEEAGFDTDIVLADMNGSADAGWSAAIRPQLQLEISPGFSDRFSFNIRTGIQHHLSEREITYSSRDLSEVRPMDNVYEMHFQFENAPVVQRTETAPKTNFFANAGIKISFGGSGARVAPAQDYNSSRSNKPGGRSIANDGIGDGDLDSDNDGIDDAVETAQDYNAARSNKPTSRAADIGDGDMDSDDDGIDDAVEMAQDYNSSRSNKPNTNRVADGGDGQILRGAILMAKMVNPAGTIISAGQVLMSTKSENPLHQKETGEGENPLYEGQANDGDSGNNSHGNPASLQRFDLQPTSYCVDLATADSQPGMRMDAQSHNSSRSNRTEGVANPDLDGDGFPDLMKSASFSISKRSARTGRNPSSGNKEVETVEYRDGDARFQVSDSNGDLDGDGYGDAEGFHLELELIVPATVSAAFDNNSVNRGSDSTGVPGQQVAPSQTKVIVMGITDNGGNPPSEEGKQRDAGLDPDSDADGIPDFRDPDSDGDGLLDALESATYSISEIKKEIETMEWREGTANNRDSQENPLAEESGWNETSELEESPPNNVYQWTYNLSSMAGNGELSGNGTLTVLFTGGKWHFDVQLDPDDDGDGLGELLQNSSFSISKRSARTGR
jgi:hypothetical protein